MGVKIIQDETLQGIAEAIRSKTGTTEPLYPYEMADAIGDIPVGGDDRYDEGYADGEDYGYSKGYDVGANSAAERYESALRTASFRGLTHFTKEAVSVNFPYLTSFASLFSIQSTTDIALINETVKELTITCPNNVTSMVSAFACRAGYNDRALKKLILNVDTSAATSFDQAFMNQGVLEEIGGTPIDFSSNTKTSSTFGGCYKLKEIRFKGTLKVGVSFSQCPLSKESILSILSVLSPEVTGKSITFNESSVNAAFETSEGANDGVSSEEWQELTAGSNWTINPAWTVALI